MSNDSASPDSPRRGLILINTGPGKGKTTAALGTAFRAAGNGMRVLFLQFLKGSWHYGELDAAEALNSALASTSTVGAPEPVLSLSKDASPLGTWAEGAPSRWPMMSCLVMRPPEPEPET